MPYWNVYKIFNKYIYKSQHLKTNELLILLLKYIINIIIYYIFRQGYFMLNLKHYTRMYVIICKTFQLLFK